MCIRMSLSVLIFYLSLHHVHQHKIPGVQIKEPDSHFDILVFSQEWPVTICKYWIHELNGSECVFPTKKNQWIVHGIWPSTTESYYTEFCNNSWPFDPEQIKSIEGELEQAWTNMYKGSDSYTFWEHEWLKHGTCATELEEFNSQFKYFSKGIEWNQKYSILDMLEVAQIFPDEHKEFIPEEFVNAVKTKTKKNPMVVCYKIDEVLYLVEIRLCFDKQLNLIDCSTVIDQSCYLSEGIIFPTNA